MITIAAALLVAWILTAGSLFHSERHDMARARHHLDAGRPYTAFLGYGAVLGTRPIFYRTSEVKARRDEAALAALHEAVGARDFPRAAHLVNSLTADADSPLGREAAAIATRLPHQHLAWAEELLDTGQPQAAARELADMRERYPAAIQADVASLQVRVALAAARERLAAGDHRGVIAAALAASDGPLRARHEAAGLVHRALSEAGAHYLATGELGAFYRTFAGAFEQSAGHPFVHAQVGRVLAAFIADLFGARLPAPRTLEHAPAAPVTAAFGESHASERAVLDVRNDSPSELTVHLNGPRRYTLRVPARAGKSELIAPGEYLQLAHDHGARIPYLGLITIDGARHYRHRFTLGAEQDGPRREDAVAGADREASSLREPAVEGSLR